MRIFGKSLANGTVRGISQAGTSFEKHARERKSPSVKVGERLCSKTQQLRCNVFPGVTDFFNLHSERQSKLKLGSDEMKLPLHVC